MIIKKIKKVCTECGIVFEVDAKAKKIDKCSFHRQKNVIKDTIRHNIKT